MLRKLLFVLFVAALPLTAFAHCDTMSGPVIKDARIALDKADLTPVLKWVKATDEAEVQRAFDRALAVRKMPKAARELGEQYFFETLVRVHRAGEGAPYTGLKDDSEVEPGIEQADQALASGSADELVHKLGAQIEAGVRARFERTLNARKRVDESVTAGREYVTAYVEFIHYVERLHQNLGGGHGSEHAATPAHAH